MLHHGVNLEAADGLALLCGFIKFLVLVHEMLVHIKLLLNCLLKAGILLEQLLVKASCMDRLA